ncbi:MAG: DNA polymerase I [Patescibacteria group bacterium]
MPGKNTKTAILIDANALLHRAWHALPPLTSPDGRLMNAAYGFTSVLLKILQTDHPDYLAVCWDTAAPTFRHKAAPEYKAQREEQPQAFYDQVEPVKQIVEALGGSNLELDGFEADDLLGTLAIRMAGSGIDVSILTSDRDVWQIIGPRIRVVAFKKGVSETVTYDEDNLKDLTGLEPTQVADYKALRGDASDNLKGVPGIGEKTATELLKSYEDLEGVFKAAHDPNSKLTDSVRRKLIEGEGAAEATLPLVKIVTDVPLKKNNEELIRRQADEESIQRLFSSLGFKTLLARVGMKAAQKETKGEKTEGSESKTSEIPSGKKRPSSPSSSVSDVLDSALEEKRIFVHLTEMLQGSPFSNAPVLALGSEKLTVLVAKSQLEDADTATKLKSILENEDVAKVGHGLKLVWHWCRNRGWDIKNFGFDTEISAYLLAAGEGGHDLASLAASRLGVVLPQDESLPMVEINAIRDLEKGLSDDIKKLNLTGILQKFELPLISVLGEMEDNGIMIDRSYFKKLTEEFAETKKKLEQEMVEMAGEDFNPASPIQLAHILFEVLGIPTKGLKRGKTGISTAASELEKLEGKHPIINKVGELREISKLLSTYVEALPALADGSGRVHTTFNQAVTSTGRLSSTNPNIQNIPIRTELGRRIRRGFVAAEGLELLSCDYSQIELRIVAALANDAKMLEAFRSRQDIHTATAAAIWHVEPSAVTKEQRRAAKAVNFGIIYGQGPMGLARSAGIPLNEARNFIDEYFMVYSGIKEYLEQTKALAHANGFVETLFGRRRLMPEINSERPELRAAAERMAINMPVQGTAADIIKSAMIQVCHSLPEISVETKLLLQVHDELVFEVPKGKCESIAKRITEIMENAEKITCPIVVEAKFGKNWDEMRKI